MKWQLCCLDSSRALILSLAVAATTLGCGSGICPADSAGDGGAQPAQEHEKRLCTPGDSSFESSFAYRLTGGGLVLPGSAVMSENGFRYLIIDKGCRFWLYDSGRTSESWGTAHSGVLSVAQAEAYTASLRIAEWSRWAGTYYWLAYDAPIQTYSFSGQEIVVKPDGGLPSSDQIAWLKEAMAQMFAELASSASAWTGSVRWMLVLDDASAPDQAEYRNAPAWPLQTEASNVAVTISAASAYAPGQSHISSADDAARLHDLRNQCLADAIGLSGAAYLPIQQREGVRYQLFVRDSISLEDRNGLISFVTHP